MENASKALIIAGAILLSILIIGLGMMVFSNAKNVLDGANLDKDQINAANSPYEAYLGDNVKGSSVKNLCDLVKNNNLTADEDETYAITIDYAGAKYVSATEINSNVRAKISNGKYYTITIEYSETTKLVSTIKIVENK